MSKKRKTAIIPTREENYPEWYQQVIKAADLAEHSPVRGCMVIKPWGYALWENIQKFLDRRFKETGHQNAYFPIFIPLSYFQKEAQHVEGFAKECAVVTHHRLASDLEGNLRADGELEEPLVIRPTSEMMIGEMFSKWIESYRDLPLLINQWANVVRWEMRTRLFLRTTEFLWQEGHTAHATKGEAIEEAMQMLHIYVDFVENILAIPVIKGEKSESERFPGALNTFTFEMMMQDGKALQGGTSHFLGQNFSKASNITFRDQEGKEVYAWTTSWGVTTRMIGGIIMTHGDDNGLILPPRIAQTHVVIVPLIHEESKGKVIAYCHELKEKISKLVYEGQNIQVLVDEREIRSGEKVWSWVKKGVPLRIEVGPRELSEKRLSVVKRTNGPKDFEHQSEEELLKTLPEQLDCIQKTLYRRAKAFLDNHIVKIDSKEAFYEFFKSEKGFAFTHWSGDPAIEEMIGKDLSVSLRCIPLDMEEEKGICPFTKKESCQRVIFAKSY